MTDIRHSTIIVLLNAYTVGITSNQLEGPGRTFSIADDGRVSRTQTVCTIEECGSTMEAIRGDQAWIRLADAITDRLTRVA